MLQSLIVFVVVVACGASAFWTLAPQAVRRALARGLLQVPLPMRLRAPLLAASQKASGCGCSGCDRAGPVAVLSKPGEAASTQPITFYRPARKP
jgi:hypothetical protein